MLLNVLDSVIVALLPQCGAVVACAESDVLVPADLVAVRCTRNIPERRGRLSFQCALSGAPVYETPLLVTTLQGIVLAGVAAQSHVCSCDLRVPRSW